MTEGPDEKIIAGLEKMLRVSEDYTRTMSKTLEKVETEQSSVHPTLINLAKALSTTLGKLRTENAIAFDIREEPTERDLRNKLDDALRSQQYVLKRFLKIPPRII